MGPPGQPFARARHLLVLAFCRWEVEGRSPKIQDELREVARLLARVDTPEAAGVRARAADALAWLQALPPRLADVPRPRR